MGYCFPTNTLPRAGYLSGCPWRGSAASFENGGRKKRTWARTCKGFALLLSSNQRACGSLQSQHEGSGRMTWPHQGSSMSYPARGYCFHIHIYIYIYIFIYSYIHICVYWVENALESSTNTVFQHSNGQDVRILRRFPFDHPDWIKPGTPSSKMFLKFPNALFNKYLINNR